MSVRYHHTQRGDLMLVMLPLGAVVCVAAGFLVPPHPARWGLWGFAVLFVVMAWLFSSLTVEVTEDEVRWRFGPGLWTHRMRRADIATTQVVRNSVLNGFGIRMRPGFRLYNVSGLDAVELRLKSGEVRRIGTDDAPGLAAALQS